MVTGRDSPPEPPPAVQMGAFRNREAHQAEVRETLASIHRLADEVAGSRQDESQADALNNPLVNPLDASSSEAIDDSEKAARAAAAMMAASEWGLGFATWEDDFEDDPTLHDPVAASARLHVLLHQLNVQKRSALLDRLEKRMHAFIAPARRELMRLGRLERQQVQEQTQTDEAVKSLVQELEQQKEVAPAAMRAFCKALGAIDAKRQKKASNSEERHRAKHKGAIAGDEEEFRDFTGMKDEELERTIEELKLKVLEREHEAREQLRACTAHGEDDTGDSKDNKEAALLVHVQFGAEDCAGEYHSFVGKRGDEGVPAWRRKGGGYILVSVDGHWGIAAHKDQAELDKNLTRSGCLIISKDPHKGNSPEEIDMWERWDPCMDSFVTDISITINRLLSADDLVNDQEKTIVFMREDVRENENRAELLREAISYLRIGDLHLSSAESSLDSLPLLMETVRRKFQGFPGADDGETGEDSFDGFCFDSSKTTLVAKDSVPDGVIQVCKDVYADMRMRHLPILLRERASNEELRLPDESLNGKIRAECEELVQRLDSAKVSVSELECHNEEGGQQSNFAQQLADMDAQETTNMSIFQKLGTVVRIKLDEDDEEQRIPSKVLDTEQAGSMEGLEKELRTDLKRAVQDFKGLQGDLGEVNSRTFELKHEVDMRSTRATSRRQAVQVIEEQRVIFRDALDFVGLANNSPPGSSSATLRPQRPNDSAPRQASKEDCSSRSASKSTILQRQRLNDSPSRQVSAEDCASRNGSKSGTLSVGSDKDRQSMLQKKVSVVQGAVAAMKSMQGGGCPNQAERSLTIEAAIAATEGSAECASTQEQELPAWTRAFMLDNAPDNDPHEALSEQRAILEALQSEAEKLESELLSTTIIAESKIMVVQENLKALAELDTSSLAPRSSTAPRKSVIVKKKTMKEINAENDQQALKLLQERMDMVSQLGEELRSVLKTLSQPWGVGKKGSTRSSLSLKETASTASLSERRKELRSLREIRRRKRFNLEPKKDAGDNEFVEQRLNALEEATSLKRRAAAKLSKLRDADQEIISLHEQRAKFDWDLANAQGTTQEESRKLRQEVRQLRLSAKQSESKAKADVQSIRALLPQVLLLAQKNEIPALNEVEPATGDSAMGQVKGNAQEEAFKKAEKVIAARKRKRFVDRLGLPLISRLQNLLQTSMDKYGGGVDGLRAAMKKFDKDNSGTLDMEEFRQLIRKQLKISLQDLSKDDINAFLEALDDDGSKTLSADEIVGFIEGGVESIGQAHEEPNETVEGHARVEHTASVAARRRKKLIQHFGEGVLNQLKIQLNLAMSLHGGGASGLLAAMKKFDKDKSGTLSGEEFKQLIRKQLKISPQKLSDDRISQLVEALDDDGSDTLSMDEIYDFIERGTATLFSASDDSREIGKNKAMNDETSAAEASAHKREGVHTHPREEPDADAEQAMHEQEAAPKHEQEKRTPRKDQNLWRQKKLAHYFGDEVLIRLQMQLNLAMSLHGGGASGLKAAIKKYDKDKSGTLNSVEFKHLIRKQLKMGPQKLSDEDIAKLVEALDDDGSGTLSADEIYDFIERGAATFYSSHNDTLESNSSAQSSRRPSHDSRTSSKTATLQPVSRRSSVSDRASSKSSGGRG